MRCCTVFSIVLGLALAVETSALPAAEGNVEDQSSARKWVEQLGDPSFARREEAASALLESGESARSALVAGLKHPDAEIQLRCRGVLNSLDRAIGLRNARQFEERVNRFLGDLRAWQARRPAATQSEMPGYRRFRELAGDDASARELYVLMGRAVPHLLVQYASDPKAALAIIDGMIANYREARRQSGDNVYMPVGIVTAMYLVASDSTLAISEETYNYLGHLGSRFLKVEKPLSRPLRAIVSAFVARALADTATRQNSTPFRQHYFLALEHDLGEVAPTARTLLREPNKLPPLQRYLLIMMLGHLGQRDDRTLIETFLDDQSVACFLAGIGPGNGIELRVADAALNVLVLQAQEKLTDYGFVLLDSDAARRAMPLPIAVGGFAGNDARVRGIDRWKQ